MAQAILCSPNARQPERLLICARRSDDTNGASFKSQSEHWTINRRPIGYDHSSPARALQALATIRWVTFHLESQAERRGVTGEQSPRPASAQGTEAG